MSSEVSLLVELYNPLYLFPIVAVVFTALMVYAFGFKSSAQPPTEVVDALNDRHHKTVKTSHESVKKRKQTQKGSSTKTDPKTQPNGHISNDSNKTSEKKTQKKVAVEPTITPKVPTPKPSGKRQKNKTNDTINQEVDDKDSGEWVELISKKERKNRKQKEEQLLMEAKDSKNDEKSKEDKTSDKSNKKSSKKSKPVKSEDTNGEIKNSSPKSNKETSEVAVNQITDSKSAQKHDVELVPERDVPDIYGIAKEQRVPKKTQKQRNTKRNSESEVNARAEPPLENEPKPNLNLSDKLTAAIVANYEGNDNKGDNTSNKKKKEKNKKKTSQPQTQTIAEINGKQNPISERNEENKASNELVIENSNSDIPNATEVKPSEEEEFKVVKQKRRPRRE